MSRGNEKNETVADILERKKIEEDKQAQKNQRQKNAEERRLTAIAERQQKQKEQLVEEISNVYIPSIVCQKIGISRATLYRWLADDSVFKKNFTKSRFEGRSAINDLAESKLIGKIKNDDTRATTFWLTHMHPDFINPLNYLTKEKEHEGLTLEQMEGFARRLKQWKNDNLN